MCTEPTKLQKAFEAIKLKGQAKQTELLIKIVFRHIGLGGTMQRRALCRKKANEANADPY